MKPILLFLLLSLSLSSFSQVAKDTIITRNQVKIPCSILDFDADVQCIVYSLPGQQNATLIPISDVYQYYWKGTLYLAEQYIEKRAQKGEKIRVGEIYPSITSDDTSPQSLLEYERSNSYRAGVELNKFANNAQLGICLEISGLIITGVSTQLEGDVQNWSLIAGGGLSIAGFIIHTLSFSNARTAGNLLKLSDKISIKPSSEGVGVAIPIK